MIRYKPIAERKFDSAYGYYTAYGLQVFVNGGIALTVGDISTEKALIEALAEKYNTEQLSPDHLNEAIEDFLYDFEV